MNNIEGGDVPKLDTTKNLANYMALNSAIKAGLVRSCHDLSEGGLAVSAAEMAFAGGIGVSLNAHLSTADLFSESNGRLLVEVTADKTADFEATVKSAGEVGTTNDSDRLTVGSLINATLEELKSAWQAPLDY